VTVTIFRTGGGSYVLHRETWSQWQGESGSSEVDVCQDAPALLEALYVDGYGYGADRSMPPAEVEAWREACDQDDALRGLYAEEVE